MLNSKNIHFALLGLILGSAIAYIYGSYRLEVRRQVEASEAAGTLRSQTAAHPEVTNEEMLAFFGEALAANPTDPDLMSRYADFLFDLRRYAEAADWFGRALEIQPGDATVRTAMATALYGSGRIDEAIREFERALEFDPGYALALHNLALAHLDAGSDVVAAQNAIRRLEALDPAYPELATLRERLERARGNQ